MLRPKRHRAAVPPCPINAGMFRPTPSSNRRRAQLHPAALRAALPARQRQRPHQARPPAPRVPAAQPLLRQLVRAACRTADTTKATVKPPFLGGFSLPHQAVSHALVPTLLPADLKFFEIDSEGVNDVRSSHISQKSEDKSAPGELPPGFFYLILYRVGAGSSLDAFTRSPERLCEYLDQPASRGH
jgi:hypothetical protein